MSTMELLFSYKPIAPTVFCISLMVIPAFQAFQSKISVILDTFSHDSPPPQFTAIKIFPASDLFKPGPLLSFCSKPLIPLIWIIALISYLISSSLPLINTFKCQLDHVTTLLKLSSGFVTRSKIRVNSLQDVLQSLTSSTLPWLTVPGTNPHIPLSTQISTELTPSSALAQMRPSLIILHKTAAPFLPSNLYSASLIFSFTAHITT